MLAGLRPPLQCLRLVYSRAAGLLRPDEVLGLVLGGRTVRPAASVSNVTLRSTVPTAFPPWLFHSTLSPFLNSCAMNPSSMWPSTFDGYARRSERAQTPTCSSGVVLLFSRPPWHFPCALRRPLDIAAGVGYTRWTKEGESRCPRRRLVEAGPAKEGTDVAALRDRPAWARLRGPIAWRDAKCRRRERRLNARNVRRILGARPPPCSRTSADDGRQAREAAPPRYFRNACAIAPASRPGGPVTRRR
jgi:hypothetical protein